MTINEIMDTIQEKLFYTTTLNAVIWVILNDMEQLTINEFIELFEYKTTTCTQADNIKWELLKNYANVNELKNINYNNILKEFYNDIKTILEG